MIEFSLRIVGARDYGWRVNVWRQYRSRSLFIGTPLFYVRLCATWL